MKHKLPSHYNKECIKKCLQDTFPNRRQWIINTGLNISNIFKKYLRLLDYNGEMIELDFDAIYPTCGDNFLAKFPSFYIKHILCYIEQCRADIKKKIDISLPINNDGLRALIALTLLLPPANSFRKNNGKGCKGKGKILQNKDNLIYTEVPNPQLLRIFPEGTSLPYTETRIRSEATTNVQPYIMCIQGQEKVSYFVQGDGFFFDFQKEGTLIAAFDFLFKLYQVLHISYPSSFLNFYNFIDSFIYKINSKPSNIASSLHINICNVGESSI
ncbi:hypothetical protein PUN28_017016 [Cardiocondyla obscurior]|uniref:Uncharacterized protein n=1 Tax=Cardiocondyla obscurior TaxID=286306 RepID=A0AAW2EQA3_9HYME